ncbi:hypothetical protein M878_43750 [Streptomyces roseochromogenus subsp. oscitans DS 12.976]|uniref:Uncharacterized protein n=1 Tax=Streptomyces roseochromogenus subsp. oscitans DS 12.976 TaxID=1352936 RepID=V6JG08_STRRC|nr:hypothetical protein M878_43750 [Streptomyces roseochromogenus subsp. oscitans DS 12.976]
MLEHIRKAQEPLPKDQHPPFIRGPHPPAAEVCPTSNTSTPPRRRQASGTTTAR